MQYIGLNAIYYKKKKLHSEVVVENSGQSSGSVFNGFDAIWAFIKEYWLLLLLGAIVIIAIVLLIWFLWWLNRRKMRQDEMYVFYERTLDACKINSKKEWIGKKRRWWWLIFGIPVSLIWAFLYLFPFHGEQWWILWTGVVVSFLLVIPFIVVFYKDKSMRIINSDKQTVGFYRGHVRRMDGYIYLFVRIGRKWVVLDDTIIIRLPENVLTFDTKTTLLKEGGVKKYPEFSKIEIQSYVWNERDNYIFIPMVAVVKEDSYFYSPTLIEGKHIIDVRQKIANSYHLQSGVQHVENLYSSLSKVTSNAVDSNVVMSAVKKTPEKERDVKAGEEQNEQ